MRKFDYEYFSSLAEIKRFGNGSDVEIVSVLPNDSEIYPYVACYYKNF